MVDYLGSAASATKEFLFGEPGGVEETSTLSPEQQRALEEEIRKGKQQPAQIDPSQLSVSGLDEFTKAQAKATAEGQAGVSQALASVQGDAEQKRLERQQFFKTNIQEPTTQAAQAALKAVGRSQSGSFYSSDRALQDIQVQQELARSITQQGAKFAVEGRQADIASALQAAQIQAQLAGQSGQLALSGLQTQQTTNLQAALANLSAEQQAQLLYQQLLTGRTQEATQYGGQPGALAGFVQGLGKGLGSKLGS